MIGKHNALMNISPHASLSKRLSNQMTKPCERASFWPPSCFSCLRLAYPPTTDNLSTSSNTSPFHEPNYRTVGWMVCLGPRAYHGEDCRNYGQQIDGFLGAERPDHALENKLFFVWSQFVYGVLWLKVERSSVRSLVPRRPGSYTCSSKPDCIRLACEAAYE